MLAVRIVFALLAVATLAGFLLTTRLKRSTPVVERLTYSHYVSPNGDGRKDVAIIRFRTKREDEVTVSIVDPDGDEVRTLALDRRLDTGRHRFRWDGRGVGGVRVPDGDYRVRVGLRRQGRSATSRRRLIVDTKPPSPIVRDVTPDAISPDGAGRGNVASVRLGGAPRQPPELLVYRTDLRRSRLVARRKGRPGSATMIWDGRVDAPPRRPAAPGTYLVVLRARDAAGNVGPARLPPIRGQLRGRPGVSVRYIAASVPLAPVRAGAPAAFTVENDARRYRWTIRRLGSRRILGRGSSRARRLQLRVPRARPGVFLLGLRVGRHRYSTPFIVRGPRQRGRMLVVLPAATWQARNPLDGNGDGFPDSLLEDRSVALGRPIGGDGLPPGFTVREAPVLLALERARVPLDITTDLALAAGTPAPARYRGVLFPAPPRVVTTVTGRLLRSYVAAGGRVGWLGTDGFRRLVRSDGGSIAAAAASPQIRNVFGERVQERPGGLVTVLGDRIGFFAGIGTAFGPFTSLEETAALPQGARVLASAGNEAGRLAVVVYRTGPGLVARVGVDGFAAVAGRSPAVARIMRRLWILLSR